MKRISSGSIGVDQGSRVLFSDFADGGVMWTGHGPRESRHTVTFSEPYADAPSVSVSISMWDLDQKPTPGQMFAPKRSRPRASIWCSAPGATAASPASGRTGWQSAPCATRMDGNCSNARSVRDITHPTKAWYTCLHRSGSGFPSQTATIPMCRSRCSGWLGQRSGRLARCGCSGHF